MIKFKNPSERKAYEELRRNRLKTSKTMELVDKRPPPGASTRPQKVNIQENRTHARTCKRERGEALIC